MLKIDFNSLEKNQYKKIIKNLLHINKKVTKRKISIGEQEENSTNVNDNIRMYKKWNLIMYKNIHY